MHVPSTISTMSALALVLACGLPACGSGSRGASTAAPISPAAASPESGETSVRPGVNDKYYEDGSVEVWTEKLEGERREVIANRDAIIAALELSPGMVVADVGAGTGPFLRALSEAVGADGKLYAVDLAPPFLAHLRDRVEREELANTQVVAASPLSANLPAAGVDLLFMCDVYHHIEYPVAYTRSLAQALAPGGRLAIVEFDKVPGKTSERMMKHVRQDRATLIAELEAEGFVLVREIDSVPLEENYMLVFEWANTPAPEA